MPRASMAFHNLLCSCMKRCCSADSFAGSGALVLIGAPPKGCCASRDPEKTEKLLRHGLPDLGELLHGGGKRDPSGLRVCRVRHCFLILTADWELERKTGKHRCKLPRTNRDVVSLILHRTMGLSTHSADAVSAL